MMPPKTTDPLPFSFLSLPSGLNIPSLGNPEEASTCIQPNGFRFTAQKTHNHSSVLSAHMEQHYRKRLSQEVDYLAATLNPRLNDKMFTGSTQLGFSLSHVALQAQEEAHKNRSELQKVIAEKRSHSSDVQKELTKIDQEINALHTPQSELPAFPAFPVFPAARADIPQTFTPPGMSALDRAMGLISYGAANVVVEGAVKGKQAMQAVCGMNPIFEKGCHKVAELDLDVFKEIKFTVQRMKDQRDITRVTRTLSEGVSTQQLHRMASQLEDYSGTDFQGYEAFIHSLPRKDRASLRLTHSSKELPEIAQGCSSASVFFVKGNRGETPYVLKVFPGLKQLPESSFSKEMRAYKMLSDLKLKFLKIPEIIKIGKHDIGRDYVFDYYAEGLMVMTKIDGEPISAILEGCAKMEPGSAMRSTCVKQLAIPVARVGSALAEIHQKTVSSKRPAESFIESSIAETWMILHQTKIKLNDISPSTICLERVNAVIEAFKRNPGFTSMTHGDAHLSNFLWKAKTNELWAIDPGSMATSFDKQQQPLCIPLRDVLAVKITLNYFGAETGLSLQEISKLQRVFQDSYYKEIHTRMSPASYMQIYTKESRDFYQLNENLWKILTIIGLPNSNIDMNEVRKIIEEINT